MKILYVSETNVPSKQANGLQIAKMCHYFNLNPGVKSVSLLSFQGDSNLDLKKDFNISGVQFFSFPKWIQNFRYRLYIIPFYSMFFFYKKKKFDLIYTRSIHVAFLLKFIGIHLIYEIHKMPFKRRYINYLLHKLFFYFRNDLVKCVSISDNLKDAILSNFNAKIEIEVFSSAAEINNTKEIYKFNSSSLNIGYVGSLYKGKGLETILKISEKLKNYTFHVIGGPLDIITNCKIPKNVKLYGYINHEMTKKYINSFDILLAPYGSKIETASKGDDIKNWISPIKLFEYMSFQKPIICSKLPVFKNILRHEDNCYLVEPDDINGWVRAIRIINDDEKLNNKISKNAIIDFKNNYTYEIRVQKILDFLINNKRN